MTAGARHQPIRIRTRGLQVGNSEVAPLEVEIRTNGGSVDALALGADQKPAVGRTVVLVPAQRKQNSVLYIVGRPIHRAMS